MDTFLKITPSCKSSNMRTRCDLQQRDILIIEEVEHALRDARRDPPAVVIYLGFGVLAELVGIGGGIAS